MNRNTRKDSQIYSYCKAESGQREKERWLTAVLHYKIAVHADKNTDEIAVLMWKGAL